MTQLTPDAASRIADCQAEIRAAALRLRTARGDALDRQAGLGTAKAFARTAVMQGALRFEITEAIIGFLAGLFTAIQPAPERERCLDAFVARLRRRVAAATASTSVSAGSQADEQ